MKTKNIRVIFDTNVWVSFLIGKRLAKVKHFITSGKITIITTDQLISELIIVTNREKIRKYFPKENVTELLELLDIISERVVISPKYFISRDPKDNFLLDLIDFSMADYLITGDQDLLEHNPFKTAQILTPKDFEKQLTLL
jgi:putative PIN family toxin of toxin-antitoxin system